MNFTDIRNWFLALLILSVSGCKDAWDEHSELTDDDISINLLESISRQADAQEFVSLLKSTGYDKTLESARTYTVWVPDNEAVRALPSEIKNNADKLKQFVAGLISLQSYRHSAGAAAERIGTLSGKYILLKPDSLDDSRILSANHYAKNGIFHIVNKAVLPKKNIWEFIRETSLAQQQKTYLLSKDYVGFDSSAAEQTGVDPATGKPVYKPGTGLVDKNYYLEHVAPLDQENGQYTFFLLEDASYTGLQNRLRPYFITSSLDSTSDLASWQLVKDLAVQGVYERDALPDTLLSVNGVKIPVNKASIVQSYKLSNGIVHVLSSSGIRLQDQLPPIVKQGEAPYGFSQSDKYTTIFYRSKQDKPSGTYRDIMVYGHGVAQFHVKYRLYNVPSGKYKVYWRAIAGNFDSQTVPFQQKISFKTWDNASLPYKEVTLNNFSEVLLGEYTTDKYGTLDFFLVAANVATTGQNTLSLDYLKLVPVLN